MVEATAEQFRKTVLGRLLQTPEGLTNPITQLLDLPSHTWQTYCVPEGIGVLISTYWQNISDFMDAHATAANPLPSAQLFEHYRTLALLDERTEVGYRMARMIAFLFNVLTDVSSDEGLRRRAPKDQAMTAIDLINGVKYQSHSLKYRQDMPFIDGDSTMHGLATIFYYGAVLICAALYMPERPLNEVQSRSRISMPEDIEAVMAELLYFQNWRELLRDNTGDA